MSLNRPLLATNFFAGDVVGGLGPYLAIYLLSAMHWSPGGIGIALAVSSITTVILQTPAGAIIDETTWKRGLLVACALAIGTASAIIVSTEDPLWLIYSAQALMGASAAFLAPLIAAVTLGVVGRDRFAAQTGANQAWNHGGNVFGAAIAGAIALWWAAGGVFWVVTSMAVGMAVSVLFINKNSIDHDQARGGTHSADHPEGQPSGFKTVLTDRRLLIFAVCVVLFHFANAAMLPLVSQKLAIGTSTGEGIAFTSACVIAAQAVMTLMALLCGAKANIWGRKPLFLAAFAVLPFRAVLYTLWDNPVYLVGVQALDGVANGIFAFIFLLILADVTQGTGRFNVAQGALATLIGVGAALSNLIAEWIVQLFDYTAAFLFLGVIALVGALIFALFMPETAPHRTGGNSQPDTRPATT